MALNKKVKGVIARDGDIPKATTKHEGRIARA